MKTGIAGIELLKNSEGCILHGYKDPVTGDKPFTIGYGNTYYEDGSKIKLTDKITKQRAEELFLNLLPKYEKIVNDKIKVKLSQNQFDALVSHTWNTGGSSTLFNLINNEAGDSSIIKWFTTKYITANGIESDGLVKRRKKECNLYFKK